MRIRHGIQLPAASTLRTLARLRRRARRVVLPGRQPPLARQKRRALLFHVRRQQPVGHVAVGAPATAAPVRARAVEVARPSGRGAAVIHALDFLGRAARAFRSVAVALRLGEAAGGAGAVGAYLFERDGGGGGGRGAFRGGGGAVVGYAVELEALAVAASVGATVAFDLSRPRGRC